MAHSSVAAFQGLGPTFCLLCAVRCTLMRKTSNEEAISNAPVVAITFQNHQPLSKLYVEYRRGIPARPRKCIGKKVRLKPANCSQNWILPNRSSSSLPKALGQ